MAQGLSITASLSTAFSYDAAGARTKLTSQQAVEHEDATVTIESKTQYFVRSSVTAEVITELDGNGQKERTFVYAGTSVVAWQEQSGTTQSMSWEHRDISNPSIKTSKGAAELEPLGMNAGLLNPYSTPHQQKSLTQLRTYPGFTEEGSTQCMEDNIDTPCEMVNSMLESGAAEAVF